jgi:hypothetical protein
MNIVAIQEPLGHPGILTENEIRGAQNTQSPKSNVFEIADRGGND